MINSFQGNIYQAYLFRLDIYKNELLNICVNTIFQRSDRKATNRTHTFIIFQVKDSSKLIVLGLHMSYKIVFKVNDFFNGFVKLLISALMRNIANKITKMI